MPFTAADRAAYLAAQKPLQTYCLSLTRNRDSAEDLCQQAMMKAWAASANFKPGTNMKAWLCTIARNAFLSDQRSGYSKRMVLAGAGADLETMGPAFVIAVQPSQHTALELQQTLAGIAALPEQQRTALLAVASGDSYEAAAAELDAVVGTIKSRVSRARKAIQQDSSDPRLTSHARAALAPL